MSSVTLTPTEQSVYNEFDRFGLLLDLPRLEGESNVDYKRRLLDVFNHRSSSTYLGILYATTRRLGLNIEHVMTIDTLLDADNNPLLTNPVIVFKDTKCYIYSDFKAGTLLTTLDRFSQDETFTLQDLADEINSTGYFTAELTGQVPTYTRAMTIFDQESVGQVTSEDIYTVGGQIHLRNRNLIDGTIDVRSDNLRERVLSAGSLIRPNQYYINTLAGTISTLQSPSIGSVIRYKYRKNSFRVFNSPVIVHNINSEDFRTKMFQQIPDEVDSTVLAEGAPTALGAYLINEILSIYPTLWGK